MNIDLYKTLLLNHLIFKTPIFLKFSYILCFILLCFLTVYSLFNKFILNLIKLY